MERSAMRGGSPGFRFAPSGLPIRYSLILDRHARNIVALEIVAGGLRAVAVETGEAGPVEFTRTLDDFLGERIGMAEHRPAEVLCRFEAVASLPFIGERTDLNDPITA